MKKKKKKKEKKVEKKDIKMKDVSKKTSETYTLSSNEITIDAKTITSKDISSKNISTSYTTKDLDKPGSLSAKEFIKDKSGKLISIKFDIVTPAKSTKDKNKLDNKNDYTISVISNKKDDDNDDNDEKKEEEKKEEDKDIEYKLIVNKLDIILDQKTFKSSDIKSKNVSTSYTTKSLTIPGSLKMNKVINDKKGNIISILFDIVSPAKNEKDKKIIDKNNTYSINIEKERELTEGNWLPLESNPDALTKFCRRMGLPEKYKFGDFIPDFMAMYNDVRAAVLLFPSGEKGIRDFKKEQMQKLTKNKQKISKNLYYLYQHDKIGNACGTIALLHALSNCGIKLDKIKDKNGKEIDSPIDSFVKKTQKMNFSERGWELLNAADIQEVSEDTAEDDDTNQTNAPTKENQNIDGHFISFILKDGDLYELDGRKKFPINHGKSNQGTFLKDAYDVVKNNFMKKAPNNPNFVFLPLCIPPF